MSDKVIQIVGLVSGEPTKFDGQFVVSFDPSRDGVEPGSKRWMSCHLVTTPDVARATRYSSEEAFDLWRSIDRRAPTRPDGKPNRPFTAFTISVTPPDQPMNL